VLGRPIELSSAREASCHGAALLALETIGKIDSIETLSAGLNQVLEPDMTRHAIYARAIERQQKLYENLFQV
jgi:sugar (pentulose or hexulose) kinase